RASLARALRRACSAPLDEVEAMGRRNLEHVSKMTWERTARAAVAVYRGGGTGDDFKDVFE
ncbi:MAG: hypothetical protein AAFW68_14590, partial [Pseudomonadota bacterium]